MQTLTGRIATISMIAGMCVALSFGLPDTATGQDGVHAKSSSDIKYWILFADKFEDMGKRVAAPEQGYVTDRAIKRRALRGRRQISSVDAPVSARYVDALSALDVEVVLESRWLNGVSAWLSDEQLSRVKSLEFVREVRPVGRVLEHRSSPPPAPLAIPAAPSFEYGVSRTQLDAINAIEPLEEGYDGTGVRVGFLDTTFDPDHRAFQTLVAENRLIGQEDFTSQIGPTQSNTHGLNTSSTSMGFWEGDLIGACHGGELLLATTEYAPTETNQEEDAFVAGMEWMERMGADIVNVSLGYSEFDPGQNSYVYEDMNGDRAITTRAADRAAELGVVVVVSAGNEGCSSPNNCWFYITSPADGDSVIAAAATYMDGTHVAFSGYGPSSDGRIKPDIAAPGVGVRFAVSNGGFGFGNGTSFSAPLTTSVVCQVLQANPNLNPHEVKTVLTSTASQAAQPDSILGYGVINAKAAVEEALSKSVVSASQDELPSAMTISAYPNPFSDRLTIQLASAGRQVRTRVRVTDVLGRFVATLFDGNLAGGSHLLTWNPKGSPAGIYLVAIEHGERTVARPVVLAR